MEKPIFAFEKFLLNPSARQLKYQNKIIDISSKGFDMLLYLVKNKGEVVEKDELYKAVWGETFVGENNIHVQISALRRILGEKRGESRFIKTIPGKGYIFVARVEKNPLDEAARNDPAFHSENDRQKKIAPLRVLSSDSGQKNTATFPTSDIEAFQDFQKGKHILRNFPASSNREKSLLTAAKFFCNAAKKDKTFAPAYAYLGKSYFFLTYHRFIDQTEALSKIRTLLRTAFSLDANLSEAFELQGIIQLIYEFDFRAAEISLTKANEIDPNNAYPFHMLSLLQCILQKFDESIDTQNKAIRLDPSSISYNVGLANRFYFAGQYEKAIVQADEVLELETNSAPAFLIKALALAQLSSFDDALENIEKAGVLYPSQEYYIYKLYLMALSGDKNESSRFLEEYLKDKTEAELNVENIAIVYSALGKYDEAIYYLEKTLERKIFYSFFLPFDPGFKPLRNNKKFNRLMKNLSAMLSANY